MQLLDRADTGKGVMPTEGSKGRAMLLGQVWPSQPATCSAGAPSEHSCSSSSGVGLVSFVPLQPALLPRQYWDIQYAADLTTNLHRRHNTVGGQFCD